MLHIIGLILLVIFFQQVVAMDLTFLFGVDLGLLMEVSAAVFILVARQQIKTTVLVIRRSLVLAKPRLAPCLPARGAPRPPGGTHLMATEILRRRRACGRAGLRPAGIQAET